MSARASKHPTHRVDRSNDSTRALAGKDPSTGAKEDTASARFRLDRGIKALSTMGRESFVVAVAALAARAAARRRVRYFRGDSSRPQHDRARWFHAWRASRGSGNARVSLGGARRVSANVARRFRFPSTRALCVRRASRAVTTAPLSRKFLATSFLGVGYDPIARRCGPCKSQSTAQPRKSPGILAPVCDPRFRPRAYLETPRHL